MKLGKALLGTAVRLPLGKAVAGSYLRESLGKIAGVPAKASQLFFQLSGENPDSTPEPLAWNEIETLLAAFSPGLLAEIMDVERCPRSASLGQVHRVHLRPGSEVAVKIQYPRVREELEQQLDQLLALARLGPAVKYGWDARGYREYFGHLFQRETDYLLEAKSQFYFGRVFSHDTSVVIPEIDWRFTTQRVLVQSWEDGLELAKLRTLGEATRQAAGEALVRFFISGIFKGRIAHGDLQPGNWAFRPETGQLVVYDFGATLEISPEEVEALAGLLEAAGSGQVGCVIDHLVTLGFDSNKLANLKDQLSSLVGTVFSPLFSESWNPGGDDLGTRLERELGSAKWWFRSAGSPWFLLLLRSALGISHAVSALGISVNMRKIFQDATGRSLRPGRAESVTMAGRFLRVSVLELRERGEFDEIVALELPVQAAENLAQLMPDSVRQSVVEKGYSIAEIQERVARSGFMPQILLDETIGSRRYKVWIS